MMARSLSETSSTRDLNTTSNALRLSRTSANELASPIGACAVAQKEITSRSRVGVKTFILLKLLLHRLRGALWGMRHGRNVVFAVCRLETEAFDSLGRQGNIVVALACMTNEETLFLFQVFQCPDNVGIRVGGGACKEFLCQYARLLLFLKEA